MVESLDIGLTVKRLIHKNYPKSLIVADTDVRLASLRLETKRRSRHIGVSSDSGCVYETTSLICFCANLAYRAGDVGILEQLAELKQELQGSNQEDAENIDRLMILQTARYAASRTSGNLFFPSGFSSSLTNLKIGFMSAGSVDTYRIDQVVDAAFEYLQTEFPERIDGELISPLNLP